MLKQDHKLAIYMDGHLLSLHGKMGFGVMRYSQNPIVCVVDKEHATKKVSEVNGMPFHYPIVKDVLQARELGAEVLVIGLAPLGGKYLPHWLEAIEEAIQLGMSIVNGLHDLLLPKFEQLLKHKDQWIWDIRVPASIPGIGTAKAEKLNNMRVLTVGTDMAVGKMTTGLELRQWLQSKDQQAEFLATGQIGITVTGKGIPLDAYKVDHAAGAVEALVLSAKDKDIVIIEGQGSLAHPGSTATLPLMRGSCPTHLILCHRADRTTLMDVPQVKIPPLSDFIRLNEALAAVCGALTEARCIGISVNTSMLTESEAVQYIAKVEQETGLPATDVIRFGVEKIGTALIKDIKKA